MRKFVVLICTLLLAFQAAKSQKHFLLPVWTGEELVDDKAISRLDVYLSDQPNGKALLVLPGGGYSNVTNAGHDLAGQMNLNGISVIILKYRLPSERHEVPLEDAEQAMRIIRKHAEEWNIDRHQVGVMGNSAGGHLAATLSTLYHSKETRPDFQILLYPVITMNPSFTHMGSRQQLIGKNPSKELETRFSAELNVNAQTPPAFIVVSAGDKVVPAQNSLAYTQALIDHQVPVSLHVYPYGTHGFGYSTKFKDADIWHPELMRWLKRNYK